MEKEFIPYGQALALKELGFDEPCLAQYRKYDVGEATLDIGFSKNEIISKFDNLVLFCSTPLYQQAFRWFREKYGYDVTIKKCTPSKYKFEIGQLFVEGNNYYFIDFSFDTYEEAEVACLRKLIEIVKRK